MSAQLTASYSDEIDGGGMEKFHFFSKCIVYGTTTEKALQGFKL